MFLLDLHQIDGIILLVTGIVAYAGNSTLVAVLNTSETSLAVAESSLINVSSPDASPVLVQRHLIAAAGDSVHYYVPVGDAMKVTLCTVLIATLAQRCKSSVECL